MYSNYVLGARLRCHLLLHQHDHSWITMDSVYLYYGRSYIGLMESQLQPLYIIAVHGEFLTISKTINLFVMHQMSSSSFTYEDLINGELALIQYPVIKYAQQSVYHAHCMEVNCGLTCQPRTP
jgi:hypothetical protein